MSKHYLKLYPLAAAAAGLLAPLVAFGQAAPDLLTIFNSARTLLNVVIVLLFIVAAVIFLWGVIKFIMSAEDEKARSAAKNLITWGIVGLIIMVAVWGIVLSVANFFGLGTTEIPQGPIVPPLVP